MILSLRWVGGQNNIWKNMGKSICLLRYLSYIWFYLTKVVSYCTYIVLFFLFLFFYCTWFLIFMNIIFCSRFFQVWALNTGGIYKFIAKKANIPLNLISLFNGVWSNERVKNVFFLKEQKSHAGYLFKTRQNFADSKTLVWPLQLYFFKKESNIWAT